MALFNLICDKKYTQLALDYVKTIKTVKHSSKETR